MDSATSPPRNAVADLYRPRLTWGPDVAERLGLCCMALCQRVGLEDYWTAEGPTQQAVDVVRTNRALPDWQEVVLKSAWGIWNHSGTVPVGRTLRRIGPEGLRQLGSLLVALADGAPAVDRWLRLQGMEPPKRRRK